MFHARFIPSCVASISWTLNSVISSIREVLIRFSISIRDRAYLVQVHKYSGVSKTSIFNQIRLKLCHASICVNNHPNDKSKLEPWQNQKYKKNAARHGTRYNANRKKKEKKKNRGAMDNDLHGNGNQHNKEHAHDNCSHRSRWEMVLFDTVCVARRRAFCPHVTCWADRANRTLHQGNTCNTWV